MEEPLNWGGGLALLNGINIATNLVNNNSMAATDDMTYDMSTEL